MVFLSFFLLCVISNTYASTDCLQRPRCAELGYTQTRTQCTCFEKDGCKVKSNVQIMNKLFTMATNGKYPLEKVEGEQGTYRLK